MSEPHQGNGHVFHAMLQQWVSEDVQGILKELADEPALERRLRGYQRIRDHPTTPPDVGFFLVAYCIDRIVMERNENLKKTEPLKSIGERLDAIKDEHGLDELDDFPPGEGPPEYERLNEEWERTHDQLEAKLYADTFREFGEDEMGRLFRDDEAEFDRRWEAGRRLLGFPPLPQNLPDP